MPEESMRLLIGLGGTGANARDLLKKALEERRLSPDPEDDLPFLIIDSDTDAQETSAD